MSSGEVVPVQQFNCQIPDEILRHVALYSEQKVIHSIKYSLWAIANRGYVRVRMYLGVTGMGAF